MSASASRHYRGAEESSDIALLTWYDRQPQPGRIMSAHALALVATLTFLTGSVPAIAQQGPRIDVLTGEPVKPRSEHPRPEPEIFNAPHAPRQEQRRADDPPLEIYVAPQMGAGPQQDQVSSNTGRGPLRSRQPSQFDPYATRRPPPGPSYDRRLDNAVPR